ncbi:MAG: uroporphyrinogen-III synthase [Staphylococcus lugdunensis]|nr:uroporphyrinogen-III synthase [Staphylococcus lugdunensis]
MKPVVVMTQTSKGKSDLIEIVHKPFIKIQSLEFNTQLLHDNYDWIIFSSKNAVQLFYPFFNSVNIKYVASIWDKTAQLCQELGIKVDFIPDDYSQEGLISKLKLQNQKLLIPSSAQARPYLQRKLSQNNKVVKIDLYTPIAHRDNIHEVIKLISNNKIDALTFSSSSAVHYFFEEANLPNFYAYYAIGRQTANTIRYYGYEPKIADNQTLESLINKIIESRNYNEI